VKEEANDYYAGKSPFAAEIKALAHTQVVKVFPGRKFVLYSVDGDKVRIHSALRANVISMDREGLCIFFKDITNNGEHLRVGYIPEPISVDLTAFLSLPSKNWVERTLRRCRPTGQVMESTAIGMFVAQRFDPDRVQGPVFVPYEAFRKRTGRSISEFE